MPGKQCRRATWHTHKSDKVKERYAACTGQSYSRHPRHGIQGLVNGHKA